MDDVPVLKTLQDVQQFVRCHPIAVVCWWCPVEDRLLNPVFIDIRAALLSLVQTNADLRPLNVAFSQVQADCRAGIMLDMRNTFAIQSLPMVQVFLKGKPVSTYLCAEHCRSIPEDVQCIWGSSEKDA
jgi:thioredoxin-like negative regulator of GroEL